MANVSKADLTEAVAKAAAISKTAAGEAVNAVFDEVVAQVAKGKRVTVVGFGTFLPRKRKARAGRNPSTGKEIKIPAKTVPAFIPGQAFKDAADKKRR
ncbi:MAG: HU family DNA-binding protein [Betaproteobacteria bacterium]|jgi:DNA-binding protein HU-beta|nr:HU family DNA-binding protein [Betaproteobacteria bacterium]